MHYLLQLLVLARLFFSTCACATTTTATPESQPSLRFPNYTKEFNKQAEALKKECEEIIASKSDEDSVLVRIDKVAFQLEDLLSKNVKDNMDVFAFKYYLIGNYSCAGLADLSLVIREYLWSMRKGPALVWKTFLKAQKDGNNETSTDIVTNGNSSNNNQNFYNICTPAFAITEQILSEPLIPGLHQDIATLIDFTPYNLFPLLLLNKRLYAYARDILMANPWLWERYCVSRENLVKTFLHFAKNGSEENVNLLCQFLRCTKSINFYIRIMDATMSKLEIERLLMSYKQEVLMCLLCKPFQMDANSKTCEILKEQRKEREKIALELLTEMGITWNNN